MQTVENSPELTLAELLSLCATKKVLKKAVLSKPADKAVLKSVITKKLISGKEMLQVEKFTTDNKALHQNIHVGDCDAIAELFAEYGQINIITTAGDAELKRSKSGKVTLLGDRKLSKALDGDVKKELPELGNDNEKSHILSGSEPFLKLLGVSDENGRVFDRKRSKFKQINRFLEHIRDIVKNLPDKGPIYVCDLCCGKSYLTFAVYWYFTSVLGKRVEMYGVDLKKDVIEYCTEVAKGLGFNGLRFECGDVSRFTPPKTPDLVISLHACDVATDYVLAGAVKNKAKVILSTPCCQHELNNQLRSDELSFITEHSLLKQKLAVAATDALRAKMLEIHGYKVTVCELIDPEETPKNVLIRAVRSGRIQGARVEKLSEEYLAACDFLGVKPTLSALLELPTAATDKANQRIDELKISKN